MSKRDWLLYVEDVVESTTLIADYTQGMSYDSFVADRKTVDAVVRNLEIIGEASKFVPDNIRRQHQEVDWQGILGLRNRIAHAYFGVSAAIVWQIVVGDLPVLRERMQAMLTTHRKG